ncbi:MAG: Dihydrofolate reductase [Firmicutes bacterium]|nr:Dihydrofolate reductase [Bacillota bacterium]
MNLIAVVDENWAIGRDGDQLIYIPQDLKRFQALTRGHAVLFGRKTMETFPGCRPLPNRRNLILSGRPGYRVEDGEVLHSLEAALAAAPDDTFVIGGESVYRQCLPYCHTAYITKVQAAFTADTYFPNLDKDPEWAAVEEEGPFTHEGIAFTYVTYRRIQV